MRKKIRIGTWNVRSLFEPGKLANMIQEAGRINIDILRVAETWWPDAGMCFVSGDVFYYSGNQNKDHKRGLSSHTSTSTKLSRYEERRSSMHR